jgi:glyoxylase-like metal-dependent hydrolase (beta-lactamase superfamily II)
MNTLAAGMSFVDLEFGSRARVIATAVLHGPAGVALVDPGPASSLPTLRNRLAAAGMSVGDLTALLLTHIHLDHAGATGTLVAENPRLRVFVHERGAPHLVSPDKLLASAARLYGDQMSSLWGECRAVPSGAIAALRGGESIEVAGRRLAVAHTPGHASHHVAYFSKDSGIAFVGDAAGVRVLPGGFVLPPTPPPDIDLDAWRASLDLIEASQPDTLFLTHFGPHAPVRPHLAELRGRLSWTAALAKTALAREDDDEGRERWFVEELRREIRRRHPEDDVETYQAAGRLDLGFRGLARYWRKRA